MTGNRKPLTALLVTSLSLLFLGLGACPILAQELPPLTATLSTEELLVAIKRRAQKILEARRAARRVRWANREASVLIGYDNNPSNGTQHIGDTYMEETLNLMLSKKLTPTLDWQGSYYGSNTHYFEYSDGNVLTHTLTPLRLRWQPGRTWRYEGWTDLDHSTYPEGSASSYRQFKLAGSVRQNFTQTTYHQFQYEWFIRDYISKKARDGEAAETLSNRVETRHRLLYTVGTVWQKALLSVKNEWYAHDSNDARVDFYDAQDHKVTASVNRQMTPRISLNASYSLERKNYEQRTVGGITAEARYDDTHTWTLSGSYALNKNWSLNPKVSHKFLASNEPTGEFADTVASVTASRRF